MKPSIHPLAALAKRIFIPATLAAGLLGWWKFSHPSPQPTPVGNPSQLPKPHFETRSSDKTDPLRDVVKTTLGDGTAQSVEARVAVAKDLPFDLTKTELEAILMALLKPRPATITEAAFAYYMHELCNKLHTFPEIRATFASTLNQLATDSHRDAVIRDYAMQHLRRVWEHSSDLPALRLSIEASLWELAKMEPEISASALLSLHTLGVVPSPQASFDSAAVPTAVFLPRIENILRQSPKADTITLRMTAVRVAGERRLATLAPAILEIVRNESEHTLVRTSAINALHHLDQTSELPALAHEYADNDRLMSAIQHAMRRAARSNP